MLTTLVLAAGESKRFLGFRTPKQFLEMPTDGPQMWENVLEWLSVPCNTFLALQERHRHFYRKRYRFTMEIWLPKPTTGQADTLRQSLQFLDALRGTSQDDILVVNCDQGFAPGLLDRLVSHGRDHGWPAALTFPAGLDEVFRWSYVDGHPQFQEAAEKEAIGTHALAGAYYFPDRMALHEAVDEAVHWTASRGQEPYVSHVYQFLLTPKVSVECRREDLYDWGTPEALERWRKSQ